MPASQKKAKNRDKAHLTRCQLTLLPPEQNLINLNILNACAVRACEAVRVDVPRLRTKRQPEHSHQEKCTVEPCELACGALSNCAL